MRRRRREKTEGGEGRRRREEKEEGMLQKCTSTYKALDRILTFIKLTEKEGEGEEEEEQMLQKYLHNIRQDFHIYKTYQGGGGRRWRKREQ